MSVKTYEEWLQEPLVQIANRMAERRVWARLWKSKAKELYRVIGAFDEEHTDIVTANTRLAKENETLRAAIAALATPANYFNAYGRPPGQSGIEWMATGHDTPWQYAAWVRDRVERGE